MNQYDAIVISDYNKGFLHNDDIKKICFYHPLTFMDTKKKLGDWADNCRWIKINEQEYNRTKHLLTDQDWLNSKLIVTVGSHGCIYDGETYPVDKVEIKDLTGAGDSFLAALVYFFVKEQNIISAIKFANECATTVVQQKGVNTIK